MVAMKVPLVWEAGAPRAFSEFVLSADGALIHPKYSGSLWGKEEGRKTFFLVVVVKLL